MFQSWRIFLDSTDGPKLHLFEFDGTPVAPLFQTSTTPNMLPTEKLRNSSSSSGTTVLNEKRSFVESVSGTFLRKRSSNGAIASAGMGMGAMGLTALVAGAVALVL